VSNVLVVIFKPPCAAASLPWTRDDFTLRRPIGRGEGAIAHTDSFAAMRSATMIVVTFVATDGMSGRIGP
jgi:hypothetical protein